VSRTVTLSDTNPPPSVTHEVGKVLRVKVHDPTWDVKVPWGYGDILCLVSVTVPGHEGPHLLAPSGSGGIEATIEAGGHVRMLLYSVVVTVE